MKRLLCVLMGLAAVWSASAKVTLPEQIGDNMVLQQNASVRLWGWTDPRTTVRVSTTWGARAKVESNAEGRWEVRLQTPAGGYAPQRVTISDGDRVVLENVLIGEVWLAGGQSNMEMPLDGYTNCPVIGANEVIARADALRDRIRYVKIPQTATYTPQDRVAGRWVCLTSETAPRLSAVGYFYAERLNDVLDVPVGIIDCNWGGSRVEAWCDRATLETYPDVTLEEATLERQHPASRPMVMYNAMLLPVSPYTVRGFIWYQGESNVGSYAVYAERLSKMVALWRRIWGGGELPFYYVEIAPFAYDGNAGADRAACLREQQFRAQAMIPSSGMISTNDLVAPYEDVNIHPSNKRDVGYRLAYMALNRTYGRKTVACESPHFERAEFADGKAVVTIAGLKGGYNRMTGIEGFELCGADGVFYPAEVSIDGNLRLIVTSKQVPAPTAVRYCFRNFQIGNLADSRGLPLIPFRTDDYPPRH